MKQIRTRTDQADVGRARPAQKDGMTHAQLVREPPKLRDKAQTKQMGVAWAQRRDTEQTWAKASHERPYWERVEARGW